MQNNAINLMTPAWLKSLSLKDYLKWTVYQRHDSSLAFDQECKKNVFVLILYANNE